MNITMEQRDERFGNVYENLELKHSDWHVSAERLYMPGGTETNDTRDIFKELGAIGTNGVKTPTQ